MSNGNGKKDAEKKPAEKPEEQAAPEEVKEPEEKKEEEKPAEKETTPPEPEPEKDPAVEEAKDAEIPDALKGKDPKGSKKPELPPIELTKSQLKLYRSKMVEHESMKAQVAGVVNQLGNEVRRGLVEGFAEELGIDLMARQYEFDPTTLKFVDFNVLRERLRQQQGMPRGLIPSSKR